MNDASVTTRHASGTLFRRLSDPLTVMTASRPGYRLICLTLSDVEERSVTDTCLWFWIFICRNEMGTLKFYGWLIDWLTDWLISCIFIETMQLVVKQEHIMWPQTTLKGPSVSVKLVPAWRPAFNKLCRWWRCVLSFRSSRDWQISCVYPSLQVTQAHRQMKRFDRSRTISRSCFAITMYIIFRDKVGCLRRRM